MKANLVGTILFALFVIGCKATDEDPNAAARVQLGINRQKWIAQAVHGYSFDYDLSAMVQSRPLHIEVRADTVNQVVDRVNGAVYANAGAPTIDSLFTTIARSLSDQSAMLSVDYNLPIGYPTNINVSSMVIADVGYSIRITNFQRLN